MGVINPGYSWTWDVEIEENPEVKICVKVTDDQGRGGLFAFDESHEQCTGWLVYEKNDYTWTPAFDFSQSGWFGGKLRLHVAVVFGIPFD